MYFIYSDLMDIYFPFAGVVYGDLGTSPLYVYNTTFVMGVNSVEDVIGVTSLVMWLLIMSPLVKYCFVVLTCDDNGEGEGHARDPKSVPTNGQSIAIRTNIARHCFAFFRSVPL